MVKLVDSRGLRGANHYSYRPVVVLTVDLGEYDEVFTDAIPGYTDALLELVPSLEEHRCSELERGGLVKRMREGTLLGVATVLGDGVVCVLEGAGRGALPARRWSLRRPHTWLYSATIVGTAKG
jgi:hypothetical protein